MSTTDWAALQSGTDIRGVAMDGGPTEKNLTAPVAAAAAAAFAVWLRQKAPAAACVAVGRDSRLSGPELAAAVIGALRTAGFRVLDCGLASTPAMFMTTVDLGCDAAIQITASHHPWYRNGLKFFLPGGGLQAAEIAEILQLAAQGRALRAETPGTVTEVNYMEQYAAGLRALIRQRTGEEQPLTGLHIVVDAGNGAGGFYVRDVLQPLGADTSGSQFLEPDGRFPNHIPNPEDKQAMQSLCDAVVRNGADFGIIFDTDVDRAGCADRDGAEINRNRLIALAARLVLADHPGATIVTDSVTSLGLGDFIRAHGGVHCRFRRGYRNVINEAQRRCAAGEDCPLAIETSGHAALRDNYFLDDGAYLMTRVLILLTELRRQGRTLHDCLSDLRAPAEERELRLDLTGADFRADGQQILRRLEEQADAIGLTVAPDSAEGVRLCGEGGFVMLRVSVHDPVMPLNAESDREGGCTDLLARILPVLQQCPGLDIAPLLQQFEERTDVEWCEVRVTVPLAQSETACAIASMAAPGGFYLEDYSDLEQQAREIAHIDLIDEALLQKDRTHAILHLYLHPDRAPEEALAELRRLLEAAGVEARIDRSSVRQEDWANNWKQYFKPLPIGQRLLICPTWQPRPEADGRTVLRIDPGMAFGTGGHETTRLVLETMERAVAPGTHVLDVGCGSGILSIAACLLGAADATGVDIDPTAVRTAVENGALNGLAAPRYRMIAGNLADAIRGEFDVIVANIVADAIVALTPAAVQLLRPDGCYIVSGIIDTREQPVREAIAAAGLTVTERHVSGGWVCLRCGRV